MSLVCHECGNDIQPSDTLPAREGGIIHPNVISLAWFPDGKTWTRVFVEAPQGIACCLECVGRSVPGYDFERLTKLTHVCDAYNAEVTLRRHEQSMEGKWIDMGGREFKRKLKLETAWEEKLKLVPTDVCLLCNADVSTNTKPFFTFKVMDRAHGEKRRSGFGSYQWSHIKTGATHFSICFACCHTHLPRIFEQISNELRQTGQSNLGEVCKSELVISPEVIDELLKESGNKFVQ
ncbi:MAG: hypothetical protein HY457_01755 [Parcubacteria group bacterium]|nr:hypothetical protein [Parcubacteria group bacterium]